MLVLDRARIGCCMLGTGVARTHFPNEQAAMKCVYLAIMSLDSTGTARKRWSNGWTTALNAFEVTCDAAPSR